MFRSIKRLFDWAGEYRKRLYLGCICSFFSVWCASFPIIIAAWGLGAVMDDMQGIVALEWTTIGFSLFGIVVSIAFRYLFSYWKARLQESIGFEVAAKERLEIGNVLKRVSLGYFDNNSTGDILTAITSDLSSLEFQGMKLIDAIVNGYINLLAVIILLIFVCPAGVAACILGALVSAFFLSRISKHSREQAHSKQASQERITDAALEYINGLPVVKSFRQEGVAIEEWKNACEKHKNINLDIEHAVVPNNCAHFLALKIASVLLIFIAGIFIIQGGMDISIFLLVSMFAFMIFGAVENMSDSVYMLGLIDASMDKLERIENADFIDESGQDFSISSYDIAFQNVSFNYGDKEVLHNISFNIPEHTSTAIVGPSGGGKSTICNLITRFYDVNHGSIKIGSHDIRELTCDSLLKNISMVFQNVYLFNDTIRNNIRFGQPGASDDEIIQTAQKARCHDFIMALPEGYDTVVGEKGSTLSGGEKQRISIARAMLKDAPIIILDEATASIDPENEHLIQQAISELVRGKTIITIAHRLATIESSDQILVVDNGQISQIGTHEQLIAQLGIYQSFMKIREKAEGWYIA